MRRVLPYVIGVAVVALIIYALQPSKPVGAGQTAPDVVLRFTEDGLQRSLSSYHGNVLVLDFWATWCAPCRFTMPKMEEFHRRYKDKGVTVIGVAVDIDDYNKVVQFAKEVGVTYPIAADTNSEAKQYYEIRNLPTLFVVDKDGVIMLRLEGYDPKNTEKQLEDAVKRALEKPAKPIIQHQR
ncbi:MAG: TlpA family protein disulfide reductase [bacterium]|nr:TlpA family protein disulfide reductase [bacterium]